jgi:hypothetical protein
MKKQRKITTPDPADKIHHRISDNQAGLTECLLSRKEWTFSASEGYVNYQRDLVSSYNSWHKLNKAVTFED